MSTTTLTQKSFAAILQKTRAVLLANLRLAWIPLCLAAGCISVAFGQDACWDLQNYHLYNAFALFHPHRHDFDIAQIQMFLNPVLDIPLYLLTVTFTHTPRFIAFCMGLPFGMVAFFTLRIAFRLFGWQPHDSLAALIAVLFGLTGTATVAQIGLATNEVPVAALVIAGFDLLLIAIAEGCARLKPLLLAGLLTGLAAGAKLTAAPYAIGLAAAALVAFPPRRLPMALLTIGLAGAIGVAATGGLWMAHLYAIYGDPIFPYDNQIFNSNWAGPWAYNDTRFFPHSRRQWLLFPLWWVRRNAMVVTEVPFADARFAAILILAPLALLAAILRRRLGALIPPPQWRAVIIFWIVGYILWEKMFSIYRYAIPLELLGGMIVVGAIRALLPARPRLTTVAAGLLTVAICAATVYPNWGHRPFQGNAIPAAMPPMAPHSMVISTGMRAVSFLALRAPRDTIFVGANSNFAVPDTTTTWKRLTSTIEDWHGPVYIVEPVGGDQAGRDIIAAEFNIAATDQCRRIEASWNDNGLRLCAAHVQGTVPGYQPAISFGFTPGDAGEAYMRDGWAPPESFGRWSMATDATIVLPVNPANHHPLRLTVLAFSVPSGNAPGRHPQIYANGKLVAQWALTGLASNYQATIPDLQGASQLILRFHIPDATAPFDQQNIGDDRALGIAMMRLSLQEIIAGK
jgi:hypothetical protein